MKLSRFTCKMRKNFGLFFLLIVNKYYTHWVIYVRNGMKSTLHAILFYFHTNPIYVEDKASSHKGAVKMNWHQVCDAGMWYSVWGCFSFSSLLLNNLLITLTLLNQQILNIYCVPITVMYIVHVTWAMISHLEKLVIDDVELKYEPIKKLSGTKM